ncbi:hypothetical protein DRP07_03490 [Archaeoglobales archaeon]|nr:MAG: hypothetical protein DRP07_03490 [Archaeoglobales archaeon]
MPLKGVSTLMVIQIILAVCFIGCSSDTTIDGKEKIFFFYSLQCSHCEKVIPYAKNASKKIDVAFCQVGKMSDECKSIAKKIGLRGVPTAAYQKGGEIKVYVGEIEVKNLMLEILEEK